MRFFSRWLGRADRPSTPYGGQLSGVERGKIIADFGAVVEAQAHHIYGVSDNLLPHPRAVIEQAIRDEYWATSDSDKLNTLEVGLMQLASFLPEPDGSTAMAITKTLAGRLPTDSVGMQEYIDDPEWQAAMKQSGRLAALLLERSIHARATILEMRANKADNRG
jgi:hypothetical protein